MFHFHAPSLAKLPEAAERENGLSSNCSRKLCQTDTGMSSLMVCSCRYQPAEKNPFADGEEASNCFFRSQLSS